MKKQYGFSLLELTLSMAIGIVVISHALSLFSEKLASQNHQISQLRLNQETRAIINLISNDIRRHGYWQGLNPIENPHAEIFVSNTCIIVSYDRNKNASNVAATNEKIAYRLNKGRIQTKNNTSTCTGGRWEALNEIETIEFDSFQLKQETYSSCINLSHTPYSNCNPDDCLYQPYQTDDKLMKHISISITMSAHQAKEPAQKIHLANHINLPNPIIITANQNGPAESTKSNCA